MSMWEEQPKTQQEQGIPAPEGAAFSVNGNGQSGQVTEAVVVKGGAYELALAAFTLAGAALSLALYVYLTREVPK